MRHFQTWGARSQEVLRTWRALVECLEENRKKLQADAAKSDKTILGQSSPLAGIRAFLDGAEREKSLPLEKDPWPLPQRLTDTERAVLIKQHPHSFWCMNQNDLYRQRACACKRFLS